jgi:hypothetical protein
LCKTTPARIYFSTLDGVAKIGLEKIRNLLMMIPNAFSTVRLARDNL